jgi:Uma2 family endonuclease
MSTLFHWTRDRYEQAVDALQGTKAELIDGRIVENNTTPQSALHAATLRRAMVALVNVYGIERVNVQLPLAISDRDEPEPDLAVMPAAWQPSNTSHPATAILVVEVSRGTLSFDRTVKRDRYALAGIPEYWIVNLVDGHVEVYTQPAAGVYTQRTNRRDSLVCPETTRLVMVEYLFAELHLARLPTAPLRTHPYGKPNLSQK